MQSHMLKILACHQFVDNKLSMIRFISLICVGYYRDKYLLIPFCIKIKSFEITYVQCTTNK